MRFVLIASACALIALAGHATAQPQDRTSYTIGLSKGAGALTCTFCTRASQGGFAGMFSVEKPYQRSIRVGLESNWWMHASDGTTRSVLAAMPVFHFFPWKQRPAYLKVGLGFGRFAASSDEEELRTTAISGVIGLAYEFRRVNGDALVPYVSVVSGSGGDMRLNGALVTSQGGLSLLQYGLAYSRR